MADYGRRRDGALKGEGYYGPQRTPDGRVATELSIDVDGRNIPALVPGLSPAQIHRLVQRPTASLDPESVSIADAVAQARQARGQPAFAQPGEERRAPRATPQQMLRDTIAQRVQAVMGAPGAGIGTDAPPPTERFAPFEAYGAALPRVMPAPARQPELIYERESPRVPSLETAPPKRMRDRPKIKV